MAELIGLALYDPGTAKEIAQSAGHAHIQDVDKTWAKDVTLAAHFLLSLHEHFNTKVVGLAENYANQRNMYCYPQTLAAAFDLATTWDSVSGPTGGNRNQNRNQGGRGSGRGEHAFLTLREDDAENSIVFMNIGSVTDSNHAPARRNYMPIFPDRPHMAFRFNRPYPSYACINAYQYIERDGSIASYQPRFDDDGSFDGRRRLKNQYCSGCIEKGPSQHICHICQDGAFNSGRAIGAIRENQDHHLSLAEEAARLAVDWYDCQSELDELDRDDRAEDSGHLGGLENFFKTRTHYYLRSIDDMTIDQLEDYNSGEDAIPLAGVVQDIGNDPGNGAENDNITTNFLFYIQNSVSKGSIPSTWLLLDNQASVGVFCTRSFLHNIRQINKPVRIVTNTGEQFVHYAGDLPGFGEVYYDSLGIANILAFQQVIKKYEVQYNSRGSDVFRVFKPDGTTRNSVPINGLYVHNNANPDTYPENVFVNMVDDNKEYLSRQDIIRADTARRLQHTIGYPSDKHFMSIINNNALPNCLVSPCDLNNAKIVYGPDVHQLMGKSTRKRPSPVHNNRVVIPPQIKESYSELKLAANVMFVNKQPFLVTISWGILFGTATAINKVNNKCVGTALQTVLQQYNVYQYKVSVVHVDGAFRSLFPRRCGTH